MNGIFDICVWVKDRQQEVRAVLEASRYISDCYMPLNIQYIHYIYLNTSL